jgi:hypothetical protein
MQSWKKETNPKSSGTSAAKMQLLMHSRFASFKIISLAVA